MATTVTYEVPQLEPGTPALSRYGDLDGNALLQAVIAGDSDGITAFLAAFGESWNKSVLAIGLRSAIIAKMDEILVGTLLPAVTLTGFKAHKEGKSWNAKTVVNEGEGCANRSCDLAAKFVIPEAPEGMKDQWTGTIRQGCQKHTLDALKAQARHLAEAVVPGADGRHIYLASNEERLLNTEIRDRLVAVGKKVPA